MYWTESDWQACNLSLNQTRTSELAFRNLAFLGPLKQAVSLNSEMTERSRKGPHGALMCKKAAAMFFNLD